MRSRDPWLDNAKMTLVVLAVIGHAWGMVPSGELHDRLYNFLYAWHMPAFVLISGYLSSGFTWTPRRLWFVVRTLVVPYLVFEAALAWFASTFAGYTTPDLYLVPIWPLWYLLALVAWRLVTPLVRPLPPTVALAGAVVVSLLGGLVDCPYLDVSRILGLFPLFVLGLVATPTWLERVRTPAAQVAGVGVLGLTWLVIGSLPEWATTNWLYYDAYGELGSSGAHGVAVRTVLLVLAVGCSLAVLSLVPRRDGWFARMGGATMVVFLLHAFVVRGVQYAGFGDWAAARPPVVSAALVVTGSVALCLALAAPPVASRLSRVVDPLATLGALARRLRAPQQPAAALAEEHRPPVTSGANY